MSEPEEKCEAGQFQYRNVFEGFDDEKSAKARKIWLAEEEVRKKKRVLPAPSKKRKGKSKSSLPKKKQRVMESTDSKEDLVANRSVDPPGGSQVGSGGEDDGKGLQEEKQVLRGGQISFRNRKIRTMNLLNSLDN